MRHIILFSSLFIANLATAHDIKVKPDQAVEPSFDIVTATVKADGAHAIFTITTSAKAGQTKPATHGKLAGSQVFSYVWPTSLDPAVVGFEGKSGTLALAVTAHPDFDDTPLYDENADGKLDNDGDLWHSHWVVLVPDEACGPKALKVRDIPKGSKVRLPKTWPGLPIFIDSPGYTPIMDNSTVQVRVPFDSAKTLKNLRFDGVTAGLRVNASVHAPLLCVEKVFKVASGDLSLPGKIK